MWKIPPVLLAVLFLLPALAPAHAESGTELSPEAAEQVQQLQDNFNALKKSFSDGQAKVTELQEKLAKLRANERLMANPQVRAALAELEKAGLDRKLANTKTLLAGFERGAKQIGSGVSDAKAKFDKIKGYYDRWNPNSQSPVRPLELLGNGLEKLQEIVTTLDPSPDNVLTKPINEFIDYYRQATQGFAGALRRTETAINNRRQNCIGQGCGLGSIAGSKDAGFLALGTDDTIHMVRRIEPALGPSGELWANSDGSRTYIYQVSKEAVLPGQYWWTSDKGQWFALQCSSGDFDQLYRGMRLAYGEIAAVPTLIARCRRDFTPYRDAIARAKSYWPLFALSRDEQWCSGKIFARAGFPSEPRATLAEASNDESTFVAQYAFKPSTRQKIDRIVPAIRGNVYVRGKLDFRGGAPPASTSVDLMLAGLPRGAALDAENRFELDFAGRASQDRQIGTLKVTAPGREDFSTQVAVDNRCTDLGTIPVQLAEKAAANDATMAALLKRMEEQDVRAQSLSGQIQAAASSAESQLAAIDAELAGIEGASAPGTSSSSAGDVRSAAVNHIMELSRQAFAIGPRMAEIRTQIEANTLDVCQSYERIKAAFDEASAAVIHNDAVSSQAAVDSLFAEYQGLRNKLDDLKRQAIATSESPPGTTRFTTTGGSSNLDHVADELALLQEQANEVASFRDQLAAVVTQSRSIQAQAQALPDTTLGADGRAAKARISVLLAKITPLADAAAKRSAALGGNIASRGSRLEAARTRLASASAADNQISAEERARRAIALNSFNASYQTALLYSGKIDAAVQGSKTCFGAADAIADYRRNVGGLAAGNSPPSANPPTNAQGGASQVAPPNPSGTAGGGLAGENSSPPANPPTSAQGDTSQMAASNPSGTTGSAQPGEGTGAPATVAAAPAEPTDPCETDSVRAAFTRADQAIVNQKRGAWVRAVNSITAAGCENGRVRASIASGNALWPPKNEGRTPPSNRDGNGSRQASRSRGPGLGKVLGGLIGVAAAIDKARHGGGSPGSGNGGTLNNLGTLLGGVGTSQGPTGSPSSPVTASGSSSPGSSSGSQASSGGPNSFSRGSTSGGAGVFGNLHPIHDPSVAAALGATPRNGSTGAGGTESGQNWCNITVWQVSQLENQVLQASRAGNDKRALALHMQAADKTVQACRRGCKNVDPGFCDGSRKNEGWPPN